jgi:hypothetical protein
MMQFQPEWPYWTPTPCSSPAIDNDVRVSQMSADLECLDDCGVEMLADRAINRDLREAARRELLCRSLAVGVKG